MLEREIADLRRGEPPPPRRARPPSTPPVPARQAAAQPIDELSTRGPAVSPGVVLALVALIGAFIGAMLWFVMLRETAPAPAATTRTCELRSSPNHADVIGVRHGVEKRLGIAPLSRSFNEWREYSRVIVRLPGHDDMIVEPPSSVTTCPTEPIELFRR